MIYLSNKQPPMSLSTKTIVESLMELYGESVTWPDLKGYAAMNNTTYGPKAVSWKNTRLVVVSGTSPLSKNSNRPSMSRWKPVSVRTWSQNVIKLRFPLEAH